MLPCLRCGAVNQPGQSVCTNCGAPLGGPPPPQAGPPGPPPSPPRRSGPPLALLIALPLIAFFGIAAVGGIWAYSHWTGHNRAATATSAKPAVSAAPKVSAEQINAINAAHDLRVRATRNYAQAVASIATDRGRERFVAIDDVLWPLVNRAIGWAYFFNTSIVCPLGQGAGGALVAYYHPWSDVALVTLWTRAGDTQKLDDVEVLMGDFIRRGGAKPLRAERPWLEGKMYRPAAVGVSTAETVRALEARLGAPLAAGTDWRTRLPVAGDASVIDNGRTGAALLLIKNMSELRGLDGKGATVRTAVQNFIKRRGDPPASEGTAGDLRSLPEEAWRTVRIVSYLAEPNRALVMLSIGIRPETYMALAFEGTGASSKLKRVDLQSFAAFYANAEKGGAR
jgi:hypothetical protein